MQNSKQKPNNAQEPALQKAGVSCRFVEGSTYVIDAEYNNGGPVELVKIYGKYFCRVKDPDTNAEWDTMLSRLSNGS